jgi:hypothetical protein
MMKAVLHEPSPEHLTQEFIDLLLDEAERALLDVEARTDEPDRRIASNEADAPGVAELRLAIAELADRFPGIHYDLESIGERLRNVGAHAAARELESHPHVTHLVRLSLEVFFRQYSSIESYDAECNRADDAEEEGQSPSELYEAYGQLLVILKSRLS